MSGGNPKPYDGKHHTEPKIGPQSPSGISSVQQRALEPLDPALVTRALDFLENVSQIMGAIMKARCPKCGGDLSVCLGIH